MKRSISCGSNLQEVLRMGQRHSKLQSLIIEACCNFHLFYVGHCYIILAFQKGKLEYTHLFVASRLLLASHTGSTDLDSQFLTHCTIPSPSCSSETGFRPTLWSTLEFQVVFSGSEGSVFLPSWTESHDLWSFLIPQVWSPIAALLTSMWTTSHFPHSSFPVYNWIPSSFFLKAYISKNNHLRQTKKNQQTKKNFSTLK